MNEILRSSTFGYAVRKLSKGKALRFREDSPDFNFSAYFVKDTEKAAPETDDTNSEKDIGSASNTNVGISAPAKLNASDNIITVGWYGDDDPENPQNWSNLKRYFVGLLIWYEISMLLIEIRTLIVFSLYTFSIFVGSSIYVPSESGVMEEFGIGETASSLGLALYVLGCMLSLPLSRNQY
jgi:DHA1 family multidrug resistance protein-like MFS transporter